MALRASRKLADPNGDTPRSRAASCCAVGAAWDGADAWASRRAATRGRSGAGAAARAVATTAACAADAAAALRSSVEHDQAGMARGTGVCAAVGCCSCCCCWCCWCCITRRRCCCSCGRASWPWRAPTGTVTGGAAGGGLAAACIMGTGACAGAPPTDSRPTLMPDGDTTRVVFRGRDRLFVPPSCPMVRPRSA